MATTLGHVNTLEELSALNSDNKHPVLVQFGSASCPRCPDFGRAIEALCPLWYFDWYYCDAHGQDTDLVEHYGITKLPAFVLTGEVAGSSVTLTVANAKIHHVERAIREHCKPALKTDADF